MMTSMNAAMNAGRRLLATGNRCSFSRISSRLLTTETHVDVKSEEAVIQDPRAAILTTPTPDAPSMDYRQIFPEFLPNPRMEWRNRTREKLERMDMLMRRTQIQLPEFYVGSILAVVVSDPHSPGKTSRFLGICTERGEVGLRAYFVLRNYFENQGIEMRYDLYNPTIQKIEVIRLEKRLDDNLRYLRDCPPEYSTFPMDMEPEYLPDGVPVPVNDLKVPLKKPPWSYKWQYWNLQGVIKETYVDVLEHWQKKKMANHQRMSRDTRISPFARFDLMLNYRNTIQEDEQSEIYKEVRANLGDISRAKTRPKRVYVKPKKTA